jgi:uncharacterized protein (TIRG00374 family)
MIGGVLLALSIRDVSWVQVEDELASISYPWILLALALYWTELALRVVRWRVLLSCLRPPVGGYFTSIAFFAGYAANNVLPAKLGEPFRADLLGRLARTSRLAAFGSIIVERLTDIIFILGMTTLGIWFATTSDQHTLGNVSRGLVLLALPVAVLALAVVLLATRKSESLNLRLRLLTSKVQNLIHGLRALREPSTYPKLLGSSLLIWMLNTMGMWSILVALNVELSFSQAILLVGMTGISAAIPAAPAGIGTLQYAFHLAALMFGFSVSAALVASTIVQVILLGSATVVGALCYAVALYQHLFREVEEQAA